jgi:hypothetical protein
MIISRRKKWEGHVARMRETRNAYRVLVGNPEEKRPLDNPHVVGGIILQWILEKWDWVVWTGLI